MEAHNFMEEVKKLILSLGDSLKRAEAIGVFGSLARRRDFNEHSDIDIFVVVKDKKVDTDIFWYRTISRILSPLGRDVTVIVYSVKSLKEISHWYILRIASEGILLFDQGGVKELFLKIIQAAHKAGLVQEKIGKHMVWTIPHINVGDVVEVKVE
ncbi:MAG TPA: nucleotidyltransferase domain-containing protein [Syntrophaceae bacterium]|nr:nucleotidyltransferase domain-containing protein [Syntrophaceae bacterium]